jgi:hypothetical protein
VTAMPLARLEEIIDASGVAARIETLLPIGARHGSCGCVLCWPG